MATGWEPSRSVRRWPATPYSCPPGVTVIKTFFSSSWRFGNVSKSGCPANKPFHTLLTFAGTARPYLWGEVLLKGASLGLVLETKLRKMFHLILPLRRWKRKKNNVKIFHWASIYNKFFLHHWRLGVSLNDCPNRLFQPNLMFVDKTRTHLRYSIANIIIGWKGLPDTNIQWWSFLTLVAHEKNSSSLTLRQIKLERLPETVFRYNKYR